MLFKTTNMGSKKEIVTPFKRINHAVSCMKKGCCGYVTYKGSTIITRGCKSKKIIYMWTKAGY